MPGLDLNKPINWDEIEEFEGGVLNLNYDFVWDTDNEGNHGGFSFSMFPLYSFPSCTYSMATTTMMVMQLMARMKLELESRGST